MSLDVNFGDKYPADNHISLTVITDQGTPSATVKAGGNELETKIRLIDDNKNKYKVRFYLPAGATGDLHVVITAGSEKFEETKKITVEGAKKPAKAAK